MKVRYLRLDEVLRIHELLMRAEGQLSALMDAGKLESAILRPAAQAFGADHHPSFAEKAAVLIQGIVVAHPFVDGNKRLGLGCMLVFLAMNNIPLTADRNPSTSSSSPSAPASFGGPRISPFTFDCSSRPIWTRSLAAR